MRRFPKDFIRLRASRCKSGGQVVVGSNPATPTKYAFEISGLRVILVGRFSFTPYSHPISTLSELSRWLDSIQHRAI